MSVEQRYTCQTGQVFRISIGVPTVYLQLPRNGNLASRLLRPFDKHTGSWLVLVTAKNWGWQ